MAASVDSVSGFQILFGFYVNICADWKEERRAGGGSVVEHVSSMVRILGRIPSPITTKGEVAAGGTAQRLRVLAAPAEDWS